MKLNINSPAYFKEHYGIDIVPVVSPREIYDSWKWKQNTKFLWNKSVVCIAIKMNFENYYKANNLGKVEQTKEMTLTVVHRIKSKRRFIVLKVMKFQFDKVI